MSLIFESTKFKPIKSLCLVGMPGSGKTSVGKCLSEMLNVEFCDSDRLIEETYGVSIKEIFNRFGEEYFREKESETIKKIVNKNNNFVLATGGGVYINDILRNLLNNKCITIFLNLDLQEIFRRTSVDKSRPLLEITNLESIYNNRLNKYLKADFKVDCDNKLPEDIAKLIIERFL